MNKIIAELDLSFSLLFFVGLSGFIFFFGCFFFFLSTQSFRNNLKEFGTIKIDFEVNEDKLTLWPLPLPKLARPV